jgi:hypothetical protein
VLAHLDDLVRRERLVRRGGLDEVADRRHDRRRRLGRSRRAGPLAAIASPLARSARKSAVAAPAFFAARER